LPSGAVSGWSVREMAVAIVWAGSKGGDVPRHMAPIPLTRFPKVWEK